MAIARAIQSEQTVSHTRHIYCSWPLRWRINPSSCSSDVVVLATWSLTWCLLYVVNGVHQRFNLYTCSSQLCHHQVVNCPPCVRALLIAMVRQSRRQQVLQEALAMDWVSRHTWMALTYRPAAGTHTIVTQLISKATYTLESSVLATSSLKLIASATCRLIHPSYATRT